MSAIKKKFVGHAENLKKRIEHPGGNNGEDTASVSFLHDGDQYLVTVTSNRELLTASLWLKGACLSSVTGKDGVLFIEDPEIDGQ